MTRFNIFNLIHKGLRASLFHTCLQLQQTDFAIDEETEFAINKIKEVLMLFEEHATKENGYILKAISNYEPSVAAGFMDEHGKDEKLISALHQLMDQIEMEKNNNERVELGNKLSKLFETFSIFNLEHMTMEENVLNNILWRYYSDEEIMHINFEIGNSVAPWLQDFYASWMMRGINNAEAILWLKSVEGSMPGLVFRTLIQKAEQELPEKRFRKITQSLTEGIMVA